MSGNSAVYLNTRSQTAGLRGVQRYTAELQRRLQNCVVAVTPSKPLHGIRGHLWEQVVLPTLVRTGLLWSPANTGPLSVENQIVTIHDIASIEHPEWFNPGFAFWYRWLTPRLIKRVRRVITMSQFSRDRLLGLANIDESKVVVIPGGVDPRFSPRGVDEIASVRKKLGIPSPHYILSLGVLEPRKNLRRLLAAWSLCASRLPDDIWLVIVGASSPSRVFRRLNMRPIPSRVQFAGFVEDASLPALYSGALALAYVSVYEGFGLPALEAMASGTLPIVADNTSLSEIVGHSECSVNPYDTEHIAAVIQRVIEDSQLRKTLESRGIRRSQEFSWDRAADSTWNVLNEEVGAQR